MLPLSIFTIRVFCAIIALRCVMEFEFTPESANL